MYVCMYIHKYICTYLAAVGMDMFQRLPDSGAS